MKATIFKNQLRNFWTDESGQTTTEYILILAIMFAIVKAVKSKLGDGLKDGAGEIGTGVNKIISESVNN